MENKQYLGDSVYAEIENGMLKLTTDNGRGPSNVIYLEDYVIVALGEYLQRISDGRLRLDNQKETKSA